MYSTATHAGAPAASSPRRRPFFISRLASRLITRLLSLASQVAPPPISLSRRSFRLFSRAGLSPRLPYSVASADDVSIRDDVVATILSYGADGRADRFRGARDIHDAAAISLPFTTGHY